MKTSKLFYAYCPELQTDNCIRVDYSVFRVLGRTDYCSKKIGFLCENGDECSYCQTNHCECPVYDEAPMDADLL